MKSTPLNRKTPLKPGGPLKRTAIKRKKGKGKGGKRKTHYRSRDREKWTNNDWKKEANKHWTRIIKLEAVRDADGDVGSYCAVCATLPVELRVNATQWNAHHIITCAREFFRHTLINGICLCHRHHNNDPHLSAHGAPYAFAVWLQTHRPDQFAWFTKNRYSVYDGPEINFRQIHDLLQEKLKELD